MRRVEAIKKIDDLIQEFERNLPDDILLEVLEELESRAQTSHSDTEQRIEDEAAETDEEEDEGDESGT